MSSELQIANVPQISHFDTKLHFWYRVDSQTGLGRPTQFHFFEAARACASRLGDWGGSVLSSATF